MKVLTSLRLPIVLSQAGDSYSPPTEFKLFNNGKTETTKGTFLCSEKSCEMVLAAMAAAGRDKLPIDYNHGQVSFMGSSYDAGRAAGWFVPANRNGELWATNVEWTPQGAKALADKEYRLFSPAFRTDEKLNVVELINVAITNLPATLHQTPLVLSAGNEEEQMDPVIAALLAKYGGDPKALAAAFEQLSTQNTQLVSASQSLNTELQSLKAQAEERAKVQLKADTDALIVELNADGRLAPALNDWARSIPLSQLKDFAAKAPKNVAASSAPVAPQRTRGRDAGGSDDTSPANPLVRQLLSQMSVSSRDYMAERALSQGLKARQLSGEIPLDVVCSPEADAFEFDPDAPAPEKKETK